MTQSNPQFRLHNPEPAVEPGVDQAWHIVDWLDHYEVNTNGGAWDPDKKVGKKVGRLTFIRWLIGGAGGNKLAYMEASAAISETFGPDRWCIALGVFGQLLEIAGAQGPETRGYILGKRTQRMTDTLLCQRTGFTLQQINDGLEALAHPDVQWVEIADIPPLRRESPTLADARRESPTLLNETETERNERELNETEGEGVCDGQGPKGPNEPAGSNGATGSVTASTSDSRSLASYQSLVTLLPLKLGWKRTGKTMPQIEADNTCIRKMAEFVVYGEMGDLMTPAILLAEAVRAGRTKRNPIAALVTWFRKELTARGQFWSDKTGNYAFQIESQQ